jgi:hypothetical protein
MVVSAHTLAAKSPSAIVPEGAVRPSHFRFVAAEKPDGDARHANADKIGEVCCRNQPNRVADEEKYDRHPGRNEGGNPRRICARAFGHEFRQQAVFRQLRQRASCAGKRCNRAV